MASAVRPLDELAGGDPLTELDAAWTAAWQATDTKLLRLCTRRMAMLLGHEPTLDELGADDLAALAHWTEHPCFGELQKAALELTEQYLIDVASATDEQVARLAAELEAADAGSVIDFVTALLVVEQRMRLELGLSAVLGARS